MGFNGDCAAKSIGTALHRIRSLGTIALPLAFSACSPNYEGSAAPTLEPGSGGSAGQGGAGSGGTTGLGGVGGSGGFSIAIDGAASGGASSGCGRKDVTALFVIDRRAF